MFVSPLSAFAKSEQEQTLNKTLQDESTLQVKAAVAEQLKILEGEPTLHKELEGLSGNEDVPVIVHLSEKPVALEMGIKKLAGDELSSAETKKIKKEVRAQQTFVKKEMNVNKISFKEGFSYDTVLNGFSATVKAKDVKQLLTVEGVTLVEPDVTVYASERSKGAFNKKVDGKFDKVVKEEQDDAVQPLMDTSIPFLGIEKLWDEGIEGKGVKVAVLDTGIDADHPDFEGIYKGGKNFIPHTGNDYARDRADDDASETSPLDRPEHRPEVNERGSTFYTSHGTHVAGTIAAIGNNPYGVKGIAPKVDLYAYRVLGAYGSGATSGIIAAIDESVKENMDVINLSLGGGSNAETDGASFAINNAMMAGTIGVIATGNSGPNRGTMGTPSTARLGIAVGNTTNPETVYSAEVAVQADGFNYQERVQLMATTFGQDIHEQLTGEYDIVAVPGLGTEADFEKVDVKGKVALISRGELAFVDKIANAKDAGAVATIIHNFKDGSNAPGISDVFLGDAFEFLPSFDMSQTDGEKIRKAIGDGKGTITFTNIEHNQSSGDEVNDSSSRGPSTPNFDIKPDVVAPGTNIMSAIPMYQADFPDATYEEAYSRKTGTSMATPHVAGVAALIKQANPTWDAFDVKVALSNTAKILNTEKYDVFDQGAGRVQPYEAVHANLFAYAIDTANNDGETVENLKGTVTFGPQSLEEDLSITKQILVKDSVGNAQDVKATVDVIKSFGDATLTIEKDETNASKGEQLLNVTLTASKASTENGDEFLGYIHIQNGDREVSLPFAADFGGEAPTAIQDMALTNTDLSFHEDVKSTSTLTFTITGDVATNYIELWDIMNPEGGEYGDGYIGYLHASNALAAGSYKLDIDGEYKPWAANEPVQTIPDGLYTIDFTALTMSGNPPTIGDYVGPVIVKSTKPEIEGTVEDGKLTGQLSDPYIAFNEELAKYGMDYDLNEKLQASYIVTKDGKEEEAVPFKVEQDGTFSVDLDVTGVTGVVIHVQDAAGNQQTKTVYEGAEDRVHYQINHEKLALEVGETTQLTVTEVTTHEDGSTVEVDVTEESTFDSADDHIVTVESGHVTALTAGTTEVTVRYEDFTQLIPVEVKEPEKTEDVVTYAVNKKSLELGTGQQEQLIVTEKTVKPDGTVLYKDVTDKGKYNVVDNRIATVKKGLVTAHRAGKTQVRVKIPGEDTILVYLEVKEAPQDIVTYKVSKKDLSLGVGQQEQLVVTEVTEKVDGSTTEKDITPKTQFSVVNNQIATVKKGLVTAHQAGKTQVRVKVPGEDTIFVYLEVKEVPQDLVTYELSETNVQMAVGEQKQLKVTEVTTKPNGEVVEKDVTISTTFKVVNNSIAKVQNGLLTAYDTGKTQVLVTIPNEETTFVYLEVTEASEGGDGNGDEGEEATPGTFTVTEAHIADDLANKDAATVTLDIPTNQEGTAVQFSKEIIGEIATKKKGVTFTYGDASFSMKPTVFRQLSAAVRDDVTVSLKEQVAAIESAVSATYILQLEKGIGEAAQQFNKFTTDMDITLPVDDSKVANDQEIIAYEKNTDKTYAATYQDDYITFNVKATGEFTAIQ